MSAPHPAAIALADKYVHAVANGDVTPVEAICLIGSVMLATILTLVAVTGIGNITTLLFGG